jgi:hypothetical protein
LGIVGDPPGVLGGGIEAVGGPVPSYSRCS